MSVIKEFLRDFPENRGRVCFARTKTGYLKHGLDGKPIVGLPAETLRVGKKSFSNYLLTTAFNQRYDCAAHHLPPARMPLQSPYLNSLFWQRFVVDHEFGHLHFDRQSRKLRGSFASARGECFADAYALARHYQRFGIDTGFDKAVLNFRARLLPFMTMTRAIVHMTAGTVGPFIEQADKSLISRGSPRDAIKVAKEALLSSMLKGREYDRLIAINEKLTWTQTCSSGFELCKQVSNELQNSNLPPSLRGDFIEAVTILHEWHPDDQIRLAQLRAPAPIN